jgi:hypothetical protein
LRKFYIDSITLPSMSCYWPFTDHDRNIQVPLDSPSIQRFADSAAGATQSELAHTAASYLPATEENHLCPTAPFNLCALGSGKASHVAAPTEVLIDPYLQSAHSTFQQPISSGLVSGRQTVSIPEIQPRSTLDASASSSVRTPLGGAEGIRRNAVERLRNLDGLKVTVQFSPAGIEWKVVQAAGTRIWWLRQIAIGGDRFFTLYISSPPSGAMPTDYTLVKQYHAIFSWEAFGEPRAPSSLWDECRRYNSGIPLRDLCMESGDRALLQTVVTSLFQEAWAAWGLKKAEKRASRSKGCLK